MDTCLWQILACHDQKPYPLRNATSVQVDGLIGLQAEAMPRNNLRRPPEIIQKFTSASSDPIQAKLVVAGLVNAVQWI